MQLQVEYTREQVIELLKCNQKAQKNWIIKKLQEKYDRVSTIGRGKNIVFICKIYNDTLSTSEGAYKAFRNILIEEYGFNSSFNYDAVLKLIDFHINNNKPISNKSISSSLNISERTIYNYRKKLKVGILKDTKMCEKVIMGRNIETLLDEDVTRLYNDVIIPAYNSELKQIHKTYFDNRNVEIAIFINSETNFYEILTIEEHNFEFVKKSMQKAGNHYIATYPVFHTNSNSIQLNGNLKQKIWELLINGFGYIFTYNLRIYEIHEDLKNNKELLNFIKLAIQHSKEKENFIEENI